MITPKRDVSVYVKLALVAVAWGGTFIAGRSLAGVAPMFSACLRFVLASAALSLFLLLSGKGFRRVNVHAAEPRLRQLVINGEMSLCRIGGEGDNGFMLPAETFRKTLRQLHANT